MKNNEREVTKKRKIKGINEPTMKGIEKGNEKS
jgi:hypothetical protein